jgi:hypothetical protein
VVNKAMPAYSIFEITLLANPVFDNDKVLFEAILTADSPNE